MTGFVERLMSWFRRSHAEVRPNGDRHNLDSLRRIEAQVEEYEKEREALIAENNRAGLKVIAETVKAQSMETAQRAMLSRLMKIQDRAK